MATTSAPLLFFLPVLWGHALKRDSPEAVMLNVTSGDWCVLPCPCPAHSEVLVLQWIRPDLQRDGYVFDRREHYLHPSYRGRVNLSDPHHNSCDVVLHNITINDTGVYECRALYKIPGSTTRQESRQVIQLRVKDPPGGDNREQRVEEELTRRRSHYGLLFAVSLFIFSLFILSLMFIFAKCKRKMEINAKSSPCLKSPSPETNVLDC